MSAASRTTIRSCWKWATGQLADVWLLELWKLVPTTEKALQLDEEALKTFPKRYRISRINAAQLFRQPRQSAIRAAPYIVATTVAKIRIAVSLINIKIPTIRTPVGD